MGSNDDANVGAAPFEIGPALRKESTSRRAWDDTGPTGSQSTPTDAQ